MDNKKDTEIINNATEEIPMLSDWKPSDPDQIYMEFKNDFVEARYDHFLGLHEKNKLGIYVIKKLHYRERMTNICNVINYFLNYFDEDKELFHSTLSIKFIIDQKPTLKISAFRNLVLKRIITDSFIQKIKNMTDYLYHININSDTEGKYKNTPKITNAQAKLIIAISFAIRCILPLSIHFSDTNANFVNKKDYIKVFDKIIVKLIKKFEKDDEEVINAISKFVKYRVDRFWNADIGICNKKKQLYGMTKEIYLEEIIHEVILVKSLYKLDYNRSVVSFIDGVIFSYHYNFKIENFKYKPIEMDPQETTGDDSERLSHAEAIEMSVYRIDESNAMINDVNTKKVLKTLRKNFNFHTSQEELDFYYDNVRISVVTKLFLETFYNRFFHDPNAVLNINRHVTIELLINMKKYLQMRGMVIIPQMCTAKIKGKYKENTIKNSKFIEEITTSDIWNNIIKERYTYIGELNQKDDQLIKKFSSFVNSTFEFVDYGTELNGYVYENINRQQIIKEFSLFLSIA